MLIGGFVQCAYLVGRKWESDSIHEVRVSVRCFTVFESKKLVQDRVLLLEQISIVFLHKIRDVRPKMKHKNRGG